MTMAGVMLVAGLPLGVRSAARRRRRARGQRRLPIQRAGHADRRDVEDTEVARDGRPRRVRARAAGTRGDTCTAPSAARPV